jgi:DNA transformation protein
MAKAQPEFVSYLLDTLQAIGPVRTRYMFGGWGIFCEDMMFGLVADDELYLKVDNENRPTFEDEGCTAFEFSMKDGKTANLSYYRCPEQCFDDNEEMLRWANLGLGAALRNKKTK